MNRTTKSFIKLSTIFISFCIFSYSICAVASSTDQRFVQLKDGTIHDQQTGLIWAAKDNGGSINWSGAVTYCTTYSGGSHADWRMPTSSELASLYGNRTKIDGQDYSQLIDVITPLITISGPFVWTARRTSDNKAMAFGFNYGVTKRLKRGSGETRRALPVRSAAQ